MQIKQPTQTKDIAKRNDKHIHTRTTFQLENSIE